MSLQQQLSGEIVDALYASSSPSTSNPFATMADTLNIPNLIIVDSLSDFPTPVASVITLVDNKSYLIRGSVNIGTNRIVVGISNTIFGFDKSTDQLIYTGILAMITVTNNDFSMYQLTCASVTAGSTVFNCSSSLSFNIEIRENIFANCKSLGTIQNFNAIIFQKNFTTLCDNGITFQGTNSELIVADNYWSTNNNVVGSKLIDIPTGGTFEDIVISRNHMEVSVNETGITLGTITLSNYGSVNINQFHGLGTFLSGLSFSSISWEFIGNTGVLNTVANGQIGFVDNVSATSITTTDTVLVATWVLKSGANKFDSPSNGIIRYIDKQPCTIKLIGNLCAFGASSYTAEVSIYKNGVKQNESKMGFTIYTAREFCTVQFLDNNAIQNDQYEIRMRKTAGGAVSTVFIDAQLSCEKI